MLVDLKEQRKQKLVAEAEMEAEHARINVEQGIVSGEEET